jgi:hypothetical protein
MMAGFFVVGCADEGIVKRPQLDQHPVVGSGTSDDRTTIDSSNQKIFDAEHVSDEATNAPPAVNADIP